MPVNRNSSSPRRRSGKVLVLVLVSLPAMLAVVGLVFDTGLMEAEKQNLQHAVDAAASAAALDLTLGKTNAEAAATARSYMTRNGFSDAAVTVNIPPTSGSYAGRTGFVEVTSSDKFNLKIMPALGNSSSLNVAARSVAGRVAATAGAAVVVLDPDPPPIGIPLVPSILPLTYPAILGGLEVLGVGSVRVDGAVHVNTEWGGMDELGDLAGYGLGPPYGISCTPLVSLSRMRARDVRVVGGVDHRNNFSAFASGQSPPLKANKRRVPDPYKSLLPPSSATAPGLVDPTLRGGVRVLQLPLLMSTTLRPGVYEWIEILSGSVKFEPGVYVIRNVNPVTGIALTIAGGIVKAEGVLFYITNSPNYNVSTAAPDAGDAESAPSKPNIASLLPSVVISSALPGSSFTPLDSPGSPYDGMILYQRRRDYRPIVIVYQNLLGSPEFHGTVYAKWGHFAFVGDGTHDMRVVAGSARFVSLLGLTIAPSKLLPPAYDVYLVE